MAIGVSCSQKKWETNDSGIDKDEKIDGTPCARADSDASPNNVLWNNVSDDQMTAWKTEDNEQDDGTSDVG